MDGYIKKSEAVDVIVKYPYEIAGKTATAIKMIEDLPSADVVPKSEVEELIKKQIDLHEEWSGLKQAKRELASEIFAEIETLLALNILVGDVFTGKYFDADLENDLAELKKKYTEDTK